MDSMMAPMMASMMVKRKEQLMVDGLEHVREYCLGYLMAHLMEK